MLRLLRGERDRHYLRVHESEEAGRGWRSCLARSCQLFESYRLSTASKQNDRKFRAEKRDADTERLTGSRRDNDKGGGKEEGDTGYGMSTSREREEGKGGRWVARVAGR